LPRARRIARLEVEGLEERVTPAAPYTPGPGLTLDSNFVSTTVFHWYSSSSFQSRGPWQPLGGRASWDGTEQFWEGQIKQMMDANIDVIYVHLIPFMEQQRINLFQALYDLRAQGYDVPKVAPFLDPVITGVIGWNGTRNAPIDLATPQGKDAFVNQYIRFYQQYYSVNPDADADSYLAQMNGQPILNTWVTDPATTQDVGSLSRDDVVSRLAAALGTAHPIFTQGIYMEEAENTGLSFADEDLPEFEVTDYYADTTNANGRTTVQVKGGYWDQNIRSPGQFQPRDGGVHYADAWNQVVQNAASDNIKQVYVESWNEFDEGSGIYAADPGPPRLLNGNPNTDTWSNANNPFEYIDTTANGAAQFNGLPGQDDQILGNDFPTTMQPGQTVTAHVLVRNAGNLKWSEAQQFRFGEMESQDSTLFGPGRYFLDDSSNEIPTYGGIFRGRPVQFDVQLTAPLTPGTYLTHWRMLQGDATWFGPELDVSITVGQSSQVDLSGSFNRTGIVSDGSTFTGGGFDGFGNALSANLLGGAVTWNGNTYALGAPDGLNVVQASGQTIALPAGQFAALSFLAAAVNGNQPDQTFTVTYTDGTTQTFTQSLSGWAFPQGYPGESIVVTMPYRDRGDGTTDDSSQFYVYGYSFALDGGKTVQSITLPNDGNVNLLAMTLVP
jgi:hypothetical protein